MRQTTTQQTLSSYTLTVTDVLLAGQTIAALDGCTVLVNTLPAVLPYTLLAGDVLDVTHTLDRTHPSGFLLLGPDRGAGGGGVSRLSSTRTPMPTIRANGAGAQRSVYHFTMEFTTTVQIAAEGIRLDADGLNAESVVDLSINDALGVPFAYGVGSQSNSNTGVSESIVTFSTPANLPPGSYVLTVGFVPGTVLTLQGGASRQNGVTAQTFNFQAVSTYSFSLITLLTGSGNVLGRLSSGAMRVVATPTADPALWYDGCFEVVSAPAAVPYLRTQHEGVGYKLALVPE